MANRFGHYGIPALILACAGLLALLLHLLVPYAHINYADPDTEDETMDRGEAADFHDDAELVGASSPGVTLAGAIVLLVAGVGLLVAGFLPMPVTSARWVGWGGGLAAVVGGLLAFTSSMYWVGSGLGQYPYGVFDMGNFDFGVFGPGGFDFGVIALGGLTGGLSGLIELILKTDSAGTVRVISPALVAAVAGTALVTALRLCGNVVSLENGVRERARSHLNGALWAALLLGLVLLLPWSMGKATDYSGTDDQDMFVFGAHTILNVDDASDGDIFGTAATGIQLLVAAGWVGVLLGTLSSLGGVLASSGAPAPVARAFHFGVFGTLLMTLLAVTGFIVALVGAFDPMDGEEEFMTAWFNLLVLPVLGLWAWVQVKVLRAALARTTAAGAGKPKATVSFE